MRNPFYISLQTTGESETIEKLRTNLWDEENRLRAVDITPDAEGVRPIAIYTYDAGGERILRHSNTSVSIYLNGKKVADTIQVDATLYPSGMTVFRPSFGGEGGGAYTKHYYAGTQRVSSKIGTTENLGDFLYDWYTQGTGGPIDVIGSSFGVLENAEEGVVQVYTELGIEPPVYDSNPVFIPVQSFVHGGSELEQYYFHPDHLGSTSYITNLLGEVSQHMEYFAFGETFVEEHRSSNNSPYKFNSKELDEETGWYYYGARYYDPRVSVWLSVDPLAYDGTFMSGAHNSGFYNSFNHGSYIYCYQSPIVLIDPNGKQVYFDKFQRNSYEGKSWVGKADVFLENSLKSAANGFIDLWNYAGSLDEIDKASGTTFSKESFNKVGNDLNNTLNSIEGYINNTTFSEFKKDVGNLLSNVEAWENISGAIIGTKGLSATSKLSKLSSIGKISSSGPLLGGFSIPKYYTYTSQGKNIYIAPNTFKHLLELNDNAVKLGPKYKQLIGNFYQQSLHSAIDDVLKQTKGNIEFDKMYRSGGNEIMFGAPKKTGDLPAVKHFRPTNN